MKFFAASFAVAIAVAMSCPVAKAAPTDSGVTLVTATPYNAKCDGSTDDSTAFNNALSAWAYVVAPPGVTCVVKNVSIPGGHVLDMQGSSLQAASGANYIVELTGFAPQFRNGQLQDQNNYTLTSTTLSGAASGGATSLVVASGTGFAVGNLIELSLASGIHHITKISSVAGATIGLLDAVPYSATACAFVSGGSNYHVNDALVVRGGSGAPATVKVTSVTGSQATGCSVLVPGAYATAPGAGAATLAGPGALLYSGSGATVTLTTSGASSGAAVRTARGLMVIDQTDYAQVDTVRFVNVPVGIEIKDTGTGTPPSYYTSNVRISNVDGSNVTIVGVYKDTNVSNLDLNHFNFYGASSGFGGVGIYDNSEGSTVAAGGNLFRTIYVLDWETGLLLRGAKLDTFDNVISDTNRDYGWDIEATSYNLIFNGEVGATFTGPNVLGGSPVGAQGVGMYIDPSSASIRATGLETLNSNVLGLVDDGQIIHLNDQQTLYGATSSTVPANTTAYLGPAGAATGVGFVVPESYCNVMSFVDDVDVAPGAGQSFTLQLFDNSAAIGPVGTISGASSYGTGLVNPYAVVSPGDTLNILLTTSSGAAAAHHRFYLRLRC